MCVCLVIHIFVSSCLATKVFISKYLATRRVVASLGGGMDRKGNCLQVCYMHLNWGPLDNASRDLIKVHVSYTCMYNFSW